MLIIDVYSVAGLIVAIFATITFRHWHLNPISWIIVFLLAMFFWPLTAVMTLLYRWDKS